jgi:hypothetical protein
LDLLDVVREEKRDLAATGPSGLGEAFFEDLFIGEPRIGDVGGAEAKDVFERAADFAKMKIDADALEQFKQRLGTDSFDRLRTDAAVVYPLVGHDVNGQGTGSMAINMKKAPGLGVGRGAPRCYT